MPTLFVGGGSQTAEPGAGRESSGDDALTFYRDGTCARRGLARRSGEWPPTGHFRTQGGGAGLAARHTENGGEVLGEAGFARALTFRAEVKTMRR